MRVRWGFFFFFTYLILSPVIRRFNMSGAFSVFSKYSISFSVTENKGLFEQVYECYLRSGNTEKSKFTFFYRTFSAFGYFVKKFNIDSSSCTQNRRFVFWNIISHVHCFISYYHLFYLYRFTHTRARAFGETLWKNMTYSFFR